MFLYRDKLLCDGCAAATVLKRTMDTDSADLVAVLHIIRHGLQKACELGDVTWPAEALPVIASDDMIDVLAMCGNCGELLVRSVRIESTALAGT